MFVKIGPGPHISKHIRQRILLISEPEPEGKIINLLLLLLLLFKKMQKKHYINIAFHNFKIKCARNKTELTFQNC